jgi:hypothetical protein
MNKPFTTHEHILGAIAKAIDIPDHLDEVARNRYRSIGEWLDRAESSLKKFDPEIYPQGSFALGTVIRPINEQDSYDLDLVCRLKGTKFDFTMAEIKRLTGHEVKAYMQAHNMKYEAEDKRRCWTIEYADEAGFHADILPAIPDEATYREFLKKRGHVDVANNQEITAFALAITDKTHRDYDRLTADWPVSNPRGYSVWFHSRHAMALARAKKTRLSEDRTYASVDEIPNYRVKTPLQRAIQLLKRHRDNMFAKDGEHKPISIILSTLAAKAFRDEQTITDAIRTILRDMDQYIEIRGSTKWVANPTNPEENFADKWPDHPEKERNFYTWLDAARQDFGSYIRERRFNEIPPTLADRLGHQVIEKMGKHMGLATPAVMPKAAALAEAETIRQSGAATRPWAL